MSDLPPSATVAVRANRLIGLFFDSCSEFGELDPITAEKVPEPFRELLDHQFHMTVTMERFLGGNVGVSVLRERRGVDGDPHSYAREIMLVGPSGENVQYGLVRIDLAAVPAAARARIEEGRTPLGRVLIEAGTLREIHDVSLFSVQPAPSLQQNLRGVPRRKLYGRLASIRLSPASLPAAVELLEIPLVSGSAERLA